MTFTTDQIKAINSIDTNSQIIACAGSGKTTTVVAKILNIIRKENLLPENIVAITYTEKAAASLKQKVYKEFEKEFGNTQGLADMYIGTIHGYCLYLLQEYTSEYKNFEILNDVQTRLFIKKTRKCNGLSDVKYYPKTGEPYPLIYDNMKTTKLQEAINAYKTFLDISREYGLERLNNISLSNHIKKYEMALYKEKFFDFTSILVTALKFLNSGTFDDYIQSKIKHMIIDEYQDVNDVQEQFIQYFCSKGTRISVVGDDDQSIYHWRGSNLAYIRDFIKRYPNVNRTDLKVNFRSSEGITEVAKQVIENNSNRLPKQMNSNHSQIYEDGDILALEFNTREEEINFIISKIKQLLQSNYKKNDIEYGLNLDDMVVLVSSVKKIPELIRRFRTENIEVLVEGTQELFQTKEISLLVKTFEILFNIDRDKVEKKDKNIDSSTIFVDQALVLEWSNFSGVSNEIVKMALQEFVLFYLSTDPYEYTIQSNLKNLLSDLTLFSANISDKVMYNLGEFTVIVNDFEKINLSLSPWFKIRAFKSFLQEDAPYIYPEGWLSPNFKAIRCLRIMTYHQAKGLEYPVVFLPFLTKNAIFPLRKPGGINAWGIIKDSSMQAQYENNMESIRRLFYVGITRSEKYLFMTRSNVPYANGKRFYSTAAQPFIEAKNSAYVQYKLFDTLIYPKNTNKKFSNDEVITLNFSLLKDLFDCPYKFQMLNVFGFTQPLNIRMGYGKSIHNMLDYIHKNYDKLDITKEIVIQKIVENFLYLPYGTEKLRKAMKAKAFKHLSSYIRNNKNKFPHILFSEKAIDYALNEYLFINGRIDLIRDNIHHTITIVDFKSSSEVLSKEQIKNQLMIYVLGFETLSGEKVDYIESYDFNDSNPNVIPITDQDKEAFSKKLGQCQRTIKSEKYPKITEIDSQKGKKYCKNIDCVLFDTCYHK